MCATGELDDLKSKLSTDVSDVQVERLCKIRKDPGETTASPSEQYRPIVVFFELKDGVLELLEHIQQHSHSSIFMRIWNNSLVSQEADDDAPLTIDRIVNSVWPKSKELWQRLCQSLTSGSVALCTIDKHMNYFKKDYKAIENELKIACGGDSAVATKRRHQIEQYHRLGDYSAGAQQMLKLKEMFHLNGDFSGVEDLANRVWMHSFSFIIMKGLNIEIRLHK